ncbi:hypothetical protein F3Y22_tig00109972pilonHSYRG00392 [Hibiscus syriacus]|uniref:Uncharacterized protein n=1 Tax=Hibiscus syriacus TaxID=106335 RepID=A0A6A3BTQ3_HIBSY|nr:hypothetical protein F3Y22_tig00109972pilonHSYRG00392 [Hibiscus syriacus]
MNPNWSSIWAQGLAMPVEVVPFCWKYTANKLRDVLEDSGCVARLRKDCKGSHLIAGAVEHGMFLDMAASVMLLVSLESP